MKRIPSKLQPWFEARKRFRLSPMHIQMARELGMNPKKFGSLANERQEPWKLPLPEFIANCYRKRFGRSAPASVHSLEELIQAEERRRKEKQEKKRRKALAPTDCLPGSDAPSGTSSSAEGTP